MRPLSVAELVTLALLNRFLPNFLVRLAFFLGETNACLLAIGSGYASGLPYFLPNFLGFPGFFLRCDNQSEHLDRNQRKGCTEKERCTRERR